MTGPSTQDSPKVPEETLPKLRLAVGKGDCHVLWPGELATPFKRAGYEIVDYIPVSNEVVEAIARRRYEALWGPKPGRAAHATRRWEDARSQKEHFLAEARADLQAAIQQVGGTK